MIYHRCEERWDHRWQRAYTLVLFLVQFAVPLTIMAVCYFLAWRQVYISNNFAIKMNETYERHDSEWHPFNPDITTYTASRKDEHHKDSARRSGDAETSFGNKK